MAADGCRWPCPTPLAALDCVRPRNSMQASSGTARLRRARPAAAGAAGEVGGAVEGHEFVSSGGKRLPSTASTRHGAYRARRCTGAQGEAKGGAWMGEGAAPPLALPCAAEESVSTWPLHRLPLLAAARRCGARHDMASKRPLSRGRRTAIPRGNDDEQQLPPAATIRGGRAGWRRRPEASSHAPRRPMAMCTLAPRPRGYSFA